MLVYVDLYIYDNLNNMIVLWRQFMVLMLGVRGCRAVEKTNDDGYIGCYEYSDKIRLKSTILRKNNGRVCKNHCFPKYRYAGTEYNSCFCSNSSVGLRVQDKKCYAPCPDPYRDAYNCGSPYRLTMYDVTVMKTPKPTSSSTIYTTGQNNTVSTNGTEETAKSFNVWYIVIPFAVVIINIIIICTLMYRRKMERKTTQQCSLTPVDMNDSTNELNTNELPPDNTTYDLETGSDDVDNSNYDTTSTYKSQLQWKRNNRNRWLKNIVSNATKSDTRGGQCPTVPATLKEDHSNMIRRMSERSGPAKRNMNSDVNLKFSSYDRNKGNESVKINISTGRISIKKSSNCNKNVHATLRNTDKTSK